MDNVYDPYLNTNKSSKKTWVKLGLLGAIVLIVGTVLGAAISSRGWSPFKSSNNAFNPPLVFPENQPRVNQSITLNTGFSAVAKAVTPAVVVITTEGRTQARAQSPFGGLEEFFNLPDDQEDSPRGLTPRQRIPVPQPKRKEVPKDGKGKLVPLGTGSGVIVTADGYVLTNNHVVEGAEKVEVTLADKRTLKATVVGTDPKSDIAVLKLDATGLPTLPLGDSTQVEVGDIVLAVGNPLGVGQTVTMGIISAKGRSTSAGSNKGYEDFLQTDAPINRGNSGGALVNLKGELVGIPSQILSSTGGSIGIGFAIPTNMAKRVMEQLVATGKVKRGMLGVSVRGIDKTLAEQFSYKGITGAFVDSVSPGMGAEIAGIAPGDIITEFNGKTVESSNDFRNMVSDLAPETTVKLKIWRDGANKEISAKLSDADSLKDLAEAGSGATPQGEAGAAEGALAGINVEAVTPELTKRLGLPGTLRGVIVSEIDADSNASGYLRRGDIITEVAKQPVTNISDFNAALKKAGKKDVLLRVHRNGVAGGTYIVIPAQE